VNTSVDMPLKTFSPRVVGCWNSLDQEMVDAPSVLKGSRDKLKQTMVGFFMD